MKKKCQIPMEVRRAGRNLRLKSSPRAGRILNTLGKPDRERRRNAGCLEGIPGVIKLKAKRNGRNLYAVPKSLLAATPKRKAKSKTKRRTSGGLNGAPGTFRLSAQQKRKLSPKMQSGLLRYHRSLGKRIIH